MKKNTASQIVGVQLISATDGSAVTTGTTTVYVTGDGGTQAAGSVGSGACTHEGNGFWTYAPAQAETNYDHIAFTFVNASACNVTVQVYPTFPQTGDSFARIGATGSGLTSLASQASVDTIDGIVDSILVDTAEIGAAGAGLTVLATQASVNTIDDFLDTEIAAIKTKTDFLPSATAGAAGGLFIAGSNAATTVNFTGNLSGSVGSVTGAVGSVTGNVGGNVAGSVASVTAGVTVTTNNDKTGYSLSSAGVTAVWAEVMSGATTAVQAMRGFMAVLLGKASGLATTTAVYRDIADTKDVISATVDADGNRTAVTRDLT